MQTKLETALRTQHGKYLIEVLGIVGAVMHLVSCECNHTTCDKPNTRWACADCWNEEVKKND